MMKWTVYMMYVLAADFVLIYVHLFRPYLIPLIMRVNKNVKLQCRKAGWGKQLTEVII